MLNHQVTNYKLSYVYSDIDLEDTFDAAIINGLFDYNGKQGIDYRFCTRKAGLIDIEIIDDQKLKGRFVSRKDWMQDRIVIFQNYDIKNLFQEADFEHENLQPAKLVIIPISHKDYWAGSHRVMLILQPQEKKAYYYDSIGYSEKICEEYCQRIGYQYNYNNKMLQWADTGCTNSVINMAFHASQCINNNKEINTDNLSCFGYSIVPSLNKEYKRMRTEQKELLTSFKTAFSYQIEMDIKNYKKNKEIDLSNPDKWYEFNNSTPNIERLPETLKNQIIKDEKKHQNLITCELIISASIGAVLGAGAGFGLAQQVDIKTFFTSLLTKYFPIQNQAANIVYTISISVVCAAILGIISYAIGSALVNEKNK